MKDLYSSMMMSVVIVDNGHIVDTQRRKSLCGYFAVKIATEASKRAVLPKNH